MSARAEMRRPLATVGIGRLVSATLPTLVVTPAPVHAPAMRLRSPFPLPSPGAGSKAGSVGPFGPIRVEQRGLWKRVEGR